MADENGAHPMTAVVLVVRKLVHLCVYFSLGCITDSFLCFYMLCWRSGLLFILQSIMSGLVRNNAFLSSQTFAVHTNKLILHEMVFYERVISHCLVMLRLFYLKTIAIFTTNRQSSVSIIE